jgi:hypothetical protein
MPTRDSRSVCRQASACQCTFRSYPAVKEHQDHEAALWYRETCMSLFFSFFSIPPSCCPRCTGSRQVGKLCLLLHAWSVILILTLLRCFQAISRAICSTSLPLSKSLWGGSMSLRVERRVSCPHVLPRCCFHSFYLTTGLVYTVTDGDGKNPRTLHIIRGSEDSLPYRGEESYFEDHVVLVVYAKIVRFFS